MNDTAAGMLALDDQACLCFVISMKGKRASLAVKCVGDGEGIFHDSSLSLVDYNVNDFIVAEDKVFIYPIGSSTGGHPNATIATVQASKLCSSIFKVFCHNLNFCFV